MNKYVVILNPKKRKKKKKKNLVILCQVLIKNKLNELVANKFQLKSYGLLCHIPKL